MTSPEVCQFIDSLAVIAKKHGIARLSVDGIVLDFVATQPASQAMAHKQVLNAEALAKQVGVVLPPDLTPEELALWSSPAFDSIPKKK
jgi:hypothetical protein